MVENAFFSVRFGELQGRFLERIMGDLEKMPLELEQFQQAADYHEPLNAFFIRVHQYTGNGRMFGFASVSDAAAELEAAIQKKRSAKTSAEEWADIVMLTEALMAAFREAIKTGVVPLEPLKHESPELIAVKATGAGQTILVVDDDPLLAQVLGKRLKQQGYKVIATEQGHAALEIAQKQKPDLVILDGMIPDMDGFSVLTKLKENKETRAIPVVMLTARRQDKSIKASMAMGAADYIVKPFKADDLIARVMNILS